MITNDTRTKKSDKINFAHQHNIPVVTGEWLVECLKDHTKHPFEKFLIKPPSQLGTGENLKEKRPVLGDKFKRKLEDPESKESNKRPHVNNEADGEGKRPQEPTSNMHESKPLERERKLILDGCTVYVSQQFRVNISTSRAYTGADGAFRIQNLVPR